MTQETRATLTEPTGRRPAAGPGREARAARSTSAAFDDAGAAVIVRSAVSRRRFWKEMVSPWPALLVFLLGAGTTIGIWALLDTTLATETRRMTRAVANGVRQNVEARVNHRIAGLEQMARLWSRFGVADPARWKADGDAFLKQHPGVVALGWLGDASESGPTEAEASAAGGEAAPAAPVPEPEAAEPIADEQDDAGLAPLGARVQRVAVDDGAPHRLVTGTPDFLKWLESEPAPEQLMAAVQRTHEDRVASLAGPLALASGQVFHVINIPLEREDDAAQQLMAVVSPTVLLETVMAETEVGYLLRVADGSHELFLRGALDETAQDWEPSWTFSDVPVRLSLGASWSLSVARGPGFTEARDRHVGKAVLGTGMVISILLGAIVHLGQVTRVRAQAMEHSHRELQSRMHQAKVAGEEVRSLNRTLEARVAERTEVLDETVAELETFSYSVSHDLRSPLGAIVNYAAILSEDYRDELDEQGRVILDRVANSAQAAVSMMDGLLAFSRIGRQDIDFVEVNVNELVASVLGDTLMGRKGETPKVKVERLPRVAADHAMLRIVWTNLLTNALKFTKDRSPAVIEIGSRTTRNEVVFFVKDNGVGFDMGSAKRLFGVFERLHSKRDFDGHGVGLAIVRRIVRRHGGRTWARAAADKGAIFFFSLPSTPRDHGIHH